LSTLTQLTLNDLLGLMIGDGQVGRPVCMTLLWWPWMGQTDRQTDSIDANGVQCWNYALSWAWFHPAQSMLPTQRPLLSLRLGRCVSCVSCVGWKLRFRTQYYRTTCI